MKKNKILWICWVFFLLSSAISLTVPVAAAATDDEPQEVTLKMRAGWRVTTSPYKTNIFFCTSGPQVQWEEDGKEVHGMVLPEHCAYDYGGEPTDVLYQTSRFPWGEIGKVVYRNKSKDLALVKYKESIENQPAVMTNTLLRLTTPIFETQYSEWIPDTPESFRIGDKMCVTGARSDVRCGSLGDPTRVHGRVGLLKTIDFASSVRCTHPGDSGAPVWQPASGRLRLAGMHLGAVPCGGTGARKYFLDWAVIELWVGKFLGEDSNFTYVSAGKTI